MNPNAPSMKMIKNTLSITAKDYHKIDKLIMKYVKSGWIQTEKGKKAYEKWGPIEESK